MSGLSDPSTTKFRACAAACAVLALGLWPSGAWSQAMSPQPAPLKSMIIQVAPATSPAAPPASAPPVAPPPAPAAAPPPHENPGLINEIGKLFGNTPSLMPSLGNWGAGSEGLTRLNTIVKGRVACPVAPNGAPDCKLASVKLCQSKGYKDGKSLDTDAAQSCSAKAMIPGRKPEEGDCRTENYVTQALCQ